MNQHDRLQYLDELIKRQLSRHTGERTSIESKWRYSADDIEAWDLIEYLDVVINQVEMNTAVLNKLVDKCGYKNLSGYHSRLNPETVTKGRNYDTYPISDNDLLWSLDVILLPKENLADYFYVYDTENLNGDAVKVEGDS